tara:strand:- start:487 stop:636 length:150 start_codon:yes stop_codon:yes gene_type:complete
MTYRLTLSVTRTGKPVKAAVKYEPKLEEAEKLMDVYSKYEGVTVVMEKT